MAADEARLAVSAGGGSLPPDDPPTIDMTAPYVVQWLKSAQDTGFVTFSDLEAVLPCDLNALQIEKFMAALYERGIGIR